MSSIIERLGGGISCVRIDGKLTSEHCNLLQKHNELSIELLEWNSESIDQLLILLQNTSGLKISAAGPTPRVLNGKLNHLKCFILNQCVDASNIDFSQFENLEKLVVGTNVIDCDSIKTCQRCVGVEFQEVKICKNFNPSLVNGLQKLSFESINSGSIPKISHWENITHFKLHNYKGNDFEFPDRLPNLDSLSIVNARPKINQKLFRAPKLNKLFVYNWKQFGDLEILKYSKLLKNIHIEKCDMLSKVDILGDLSEIKELVISNCLAEEQFTAILKLRQIERLRINIKGKLEPTFDELCRSLNLSPIGDRATGGIKPKPKYMETGNWWDW